MAERYTAGMGMNQKRKVRRTLTDRLHMALRDAQSGRMSQPEDVRSEPEEPATRRAKPSRAPHLVDVKDEPEDVKSELGDVKAELADVRSEEEDEPADEAWEVHSKSEAQGLEEEASEPEVGGGGAFAWIESGLRRKQHEDAAGGGRVRLLPATACKSAARRGSSSSAAGGSAEPPWRSRSGPGPLAGGRDVLPRWRVEDDLLEMERGGSAE